MLLILIAPIFIAWGFVLLGKQSALLSHYKKTDGVLVAYELDTNTKKFHQIFSFTYMKEKYFFKSSYSKQFVKEVLGSKHTVFIKPEMSKEDSSKVASVKATLLDLSHQSIQAAVLFALGSLCLWLFAQVTGLYFLFVLYLAALYFLYSYASKNMFFGDSFSSGNLNTEASGFSATFKEEEFKKAKFLDLTSTRIGRESWLSSQKAKGYICITLAALCFFMTDFSLNTEPELTKVEAVKKAPTMDEIIDAGSVEAAQDKAAENDPPAFCIWFESNSCYFTYKYLEPKDAAVFLQRVLNFLIQDIGIFIALLAGFFLFSRQIYNQYDYVEVPKESKT